MSWPVQQTKTFILQSFLDGFDDTNSTSFTRMRLFLLLLFASSSLGATFGRFGFPFGRQSPQQYGPPPNLQGSINSGYLPPTTNRPTGCTPSTVVITQTQYSTFFQTSTVFNNQGAIITRTEFSTRVVPTVVVSNILSTQVINSGVTQTQYITITRTNTRTQIVTQPGSFQTITSTQIVDRPQVSFQTQFITQNIPVQSTGFTTVFSTQVIPQQVVSTVFQTQFITRTMQLPGQTRTVVSTIVSQIFSTVTIPGQTIFNTQTVFSTNFIQQTVTQPGQTRTVFSTVVRPVFTTFFSTIFRGNTQTQIATSTQFTQIVTTSASFVQVPNFNTRTVTVPQVSTSVVFRNTVVTSTGFTQIVIPTVVTIPGQNNIVTITRTVFSTVVLPGSGSTIFITRPVVSTNFATSTVYNTAVQTTQITRTVQGNCGGGTTTGYNNYYNTPAVPFNPLG